MPAPSSSMDLWDDDGVAIQRRPEARTTGAKGDWFIDAENQHHAVTAARRRAVERTVAKPNKRAAVPIPLAGQSYHPDEKDHEEAVNFAASKIISRKAAHDKFVKSMNLRTPKEYKGDLNTDKTWEEEVQGPGTAGKKLPAGSSTDAALPAAAAADRTKAEKAKAAKAKAKKSKNAIEVRRDTRRSRMHARHPDRKSVEADADRLDELQLEVDKETRKSERRALRKLVRKAEGQQLVKYGRNMHTPLLPDVLPKAAHTGALRHVKPAAVHHPALDRAKSLEERGLVPARMRHTYNKRKMLKAKGEVRVVTEEFGGLVEQKF